MKIEKQIVGSTIFEVYNVRTGETVSTFRSKLSARRKADKLDLEYGAINFAIREVSC